MLEEGTGKSPSRGWGWPLLLVTPALLIGLAAAFGEGSVVDWVIRQGFAPVCHQIGDRAIAVAGSRLVVCARCAGFYSGLAAAGIIVAAADGLGRRWRVQTVWFLLLIPLAVDGTANLLGVWSTPAAGRAVIGLLAAVPLAAALSETRHATI